MAANTFTLVRATAQQLIYSYDNQAGPGTIAMATLITDSGGAAGTSPINVALRSVDGQVNSTADAEAALLTGKAFTGFASATSIISNIQSHVRPLTFTAGKAPPCLTCVESGAGNDPELTLTSDTASATGFVVITHSWSPTV